MGAEGNITIIHSLYEAFGRGDVAGILEALAEDVDWATETSVDGAPWYGPHRGKDTVPSFFEAFGSSMDVQDFTPTAFAANETDVFSIVRCSGTARSTGKPFATNLHHYFRFRDGLIYHYRGTEDTAQIVAALSD